LRKTSSIALPKFGKTVVAILVVVISLLSITSISSLANAGTGNGAPSGPHYNLNIIGVEKGGSASSTSNGHVIFVPLTGNCKIDLQEGSFAVIDSNCLQGDALFQLPNPDSGTGYLTYSVWVRAVTPKGSALMQTCFTDTSVTPSQTYCNTGDLIVSVKKVTPPKFTDVSKQLLQVCVSGSLEPIFKNSYYQYFWYYQDTGLRLAQFRFYPISTTAIGGSCSSTSTTIS
jgi:hypothetical protein